MCETLVVCCVLWCFWYERECSAYMCQASRTHDKREYHQNTQQSNKSVEKQKHRKKQQQHTTNVRRNYFQPELYTHSERERIRNIARKTVLGWITRISRVGAVCICTPRVCTYSSPCPTDRERKALFIELLSFFPFTCLPFVKTARLFFPFHSCSLCVFAVVHTHTQWW